MSSTTRTAAILAVVAAPVAGALVATVPAGGLGFGALTGGAAAAAVLVPMLAQRRRPFELETASSTGPPPQVLLWSLRLFLPLMSTVVTTQGVSAGLLLLMAGYGLVQTLGPVPRLRGVWIGLGPILALVAVSAVAWIIGVAVTGTLSAARFLVMLASAGAALCVVLAILRTSPRYRALLVRALIDSLAIYVLASVGAYYLLGLRSPVDESRLVIPSSTIGFGTRVTFPFSYALSTPPFLAAAFLSGTLPLFRRVDGWRRLVYGLGALAALVILVAADNRVPLALAGMVGLAVLVAPRVFARVAPALALSAMTLPFWWGAAQPIVVPIMQDVGSSVRLLNRGFEGEYSTLQYRTLLWDALFDGAAAMDPVQLVFGNGAIGQRPSGLAQAYAPYFLNLDDPLAGSAHNALLQQFTDTGLLGAAMLFGIVMLTGLAIRRGSTQADEKSDRASLTAVAAVYVVLIGGTSTESALSTGSPSEVVWLLPILLATSLSFAGSRPTPELDRTFERPESRLPSWVVERDRSDRGNRHPLRSSG